MEANQNIGNAKSEQMLSSEEILNGLFSKALHRKSLETSTIEELRNEMHMHFAKLIEENMRMKAQLEAEQKKNVQPPLKRNLLNHKHDNIAQTQMNGIKDDADDRADPTSHKPNIDVLSGDHHIDELSIKARSEDVNGHDAADGITDDAATNDEQISQLLEESQSCIDEYLSSTQVLSDETVSIKRKKRRQARG